MTRVDKCSVGTGHPDLLPVQTSQGIGSAGYLTENMSLLNHILMFGELHHQESIFFPL